MKRALFVLIVILAAVCIMAPGPSSTQPPPIVTKPPVETPPPPPPTEPPEVTEPPGTEQPGPTEPSSNPHPEGGKGKPGQEREIRLPAGGYGPQEQGSGIEGLAMLIGSLCFFVVVLVFVASALGVILERRQKLEQIEREERNKFRI